MVKKAAILAAGRGTRFLPYTKASPKEMIAVVDKPVLQIIVEEVLAAGINEILLIINSDKIAVKQHFSPDAVLESFLIERKKLQDLELVKRVGSLADFKYAYQEVPRGSGDAVLLAEQFAAGEPIAILNGDDAMYTGSGESVTKQLANCYNRTKTSVIGVQEVERTAIQKYGAIEIISRNGNDIKIKGITEKPDPDSAPSLYAALGRYIISPDFFDYIRKTPVAANGELQFTDALKLQAREKGIYAYEFTGKRYDLGDKLGYVQATVEYALRDENLGADFAKYLKKLSETL